MRGSMPPALLSWRAASIQNFRRPKVGHALKLRQLGGSALVVVEASDDAKLRPRLAALLRSASAVLLSLPIRCSTPGARVSSHHSEPCRRLPISSTMSSTAASSLQPGITDHLSPSDVCQSHPQRRTHAIVPIMQPNRSTTWSSTSRLPKHFASTCLIRIRYLHQQGSR